MAIHPTALVDPKAEIDPSVEVGPFSVIGPDVKIGSNSVVKSHVVINGHTTIGQNNEIYQFASVGEANQDKKYKGEPTELVIGDHNVIRENATIHRGTVQDNGITQIGDHNLFMASTHVGHDCIIGDNNIFANYAALAGHVKVGDFVIFGGYTGIHQFCQVNSYSMCGMGSMVAKDIPQFMMVSGSPAKAHGMNFEGMRRRGVSQDVIRALRKAYKIIYLKGLTLERALHDIEQDDIYHISDVAEFVLSIRRSKRGIIR
ncbi:Acyl-[acyl-carrier-protein]--UDP-N-acetylglucosamine O-acyltransferase [Marinomonas spartinae]|uniref:Acyl-[acyl-carrier-protein]--UDP-N-acetylglucosamine O-acyltransferase n=1 Tax=Marinomonas spartinae TaxID=1792290 RepID=A0A1A8TAC7_9GAMM|nr:acyl-ACP--UDP-N-acetylglucosamine O-acyltransferase [Marinomonas spartinae]SBS27679.1 Acyl-[acyl-carrier-protein]--UDP-N-acetylglucosamine O-acyltransferase [Marinomonas spartinae]SBS28656.1 Acyl-[acyl-carrier-protein]--UDP-N-acetylglucosamine O-acyltransferase [Marinomonas spartinae]